MSKKTGVSFLKSMLKFSLGSWVQAAIAFISVPIVTRAFSPEEFGKFNMFTLAVSICSIFVGLSMEQSYFRFFKEKDSLNDKKKMLTQCIAVCLLAFIIFLIFVVIFGNSLSNYLFGEINQNVIYIALPLMVLLTIFMSYQSIYFRMSENATGYFIFGVLSVIANKIFMILSALYNPTYTVGIYFTVLGVSMVAVGYKIFCKNSFDIYLPIFKKNEALPYIKYSFPLIPVAIIGFLNVAVVRVLLKDYLSYTALGIFTAAITVAGLLSLIQTGFTIYWTPFMYNNYKTELKLIKKVHSGITFAMITMAILIILFSDIIFLILGEKYRLGKSIFAFLLITPVVETISLTTCYGIFINKKTHLHIYSATISFAINAIIGFLLIPKIGILGAAIANATGGIALFLARTFLGLREYNSVEKFSRTIYSIIILIIASYINYIITNVIYRDVSIIILLFLVGFMYRDIVRLGINLIKKGNR